MNIRELIWGALLTAMALLIPLAFRGWLQVVIPPFSATLGSHVPSMLAMFISPWVAAMVGIGSTFGFLVTLGPIIAARASTHILFGVVGALLYRQGVKPLHVLVLVAPIHFLAEALVVAIAGLGWYAAVVTVGAGTLLHHAADAAITLALFGMLLKAGFNWQFSPSKI